MTHWVSVTFVELKNTPKADHFGFCFKAKNLNNLQSFRFYLLDSENKEIEFIHKLNKLN